MSRSINQVTLKLQTSAWIRSKPTHLEFSSVLLPFDLSPSEVEPGSATQGGWDPLLASFFHLFFSTITHDIVPVFATYIKV